MSSSSPEDKKTKRKDENDNEKTNETEEKHSGHQQKVAVIVNLQVNGRKRSSKAIDTNCENSTKENKLVNGTNSKKKSSIGFQMESNAVARRNERERNRVRLVNDGFSSLRQHIPYFPDKKKLSKVETLRCAVSYIKHLQKLIEEHDEQLAVYSEEENTSNETNYTAKWVTSTSL